MKYINKTAVLCIVCCLGILATNYRVSGQARQQNKTQQIVLPPQLLPPHPADKFDKRYYQIDAKRMVTDMNSEDALPRSREFLRIDSTYYVGYLFEGVYKYNHAADYLGFKNAAIPLEHALYQIERDYKQALATRTDDVMKFIPIYKIQFDYSLIAYFLMNCYANTDQQEKVFQLLRRDVKWNFQLQNAMDAWNYLAWTVHRNRFYTHAKYSFLKNSIEENERLANSYLDTGMLYIKRNNFLNEKLQPGSQNENNEKLSVYHYKNILASYNFDIDSANYYFSLMRKAGRLPHNNYANFMAVCGDFRTAEFEYRIAAEQDAGEKRLQEWAYYSSILDIYKAKPDEGALLSREMIKAGGLTPGFGWYNIALARCMTYCGLTDDALRYADRAAGFKETHIGTTLGQSQYDFSIQLIKLINKEHQWAMQKFEHSNWWYNPSILSTMGHLSADRYMQQFLIINQFAQNPERDRVIYKLFSTESTVSWDEIWYLIHDFTTQFFLDRFKKEAETDKRKNIRKYFELFQAKLMMQQGDNKAAKKILDGLLNSAEIDAGYEKLLLARIYESEAECSDKLGLNDKKEWLYKFYAVYPQLTPFSGQKIDLNLFTSGDEDNEVIKRLKDCNIHFTSNAINAADAYVIFSNKGSKKEITYYVMDRNGNYVVPKHTFSWQKAADAGVSLAYRLCNISPMDLDDIKAAKDAGKKK